MVFYDYLKKIFIVCVYDVVIEMEFEFVCNLLVWLCNVVYLKCEDNQLVFLFKLCGVYNKMVYILMDVFVCGVIMVLVGNYVQGVVFLVVWMGIKVVIVVLVMMLQVKVDVVCVYGGLSVEVIQVGELYSDVYVYVVKVQQECDFMFVYLFDDLYVIVGQGMIVMEILCQYQGLIYVIFVLIGGGGFVFGVVVYVKVVCLEIKVIGVQVEDLCVMKQLLDVGECIELSEVGLFVDGIVVKFVGEEIFWLCCEFFDGVVMVNIDVLCVVIKDVFQDMCSVFELLGVFVVVGVKLYVECEGIENQMFVVVMFGVNMNFDWMCFVVECVEVGEVCEVVFVVMIFEECGSFKCFCLLVGDCNVIEFNYWIVDEKFVYIFVGVQICCCGELVEIVVNFELYGFKSVDLMYDELLKEYICYMVGGCLLFVFDECLFCFEFLEWLGVLMKFLLLMVLDWNISLFYYCNQGVDYSLIFVGLQVLQVDCVEFECFFVVFGYLYVEESVNLVYCFFLL